MQVFVSARPLSAGIGICFETAKNTKAFKCVFTGFQRSLWKFRTTGNLYPLKSWLWLAVVACVVRWPISNALLNDIWLKCFTQMCNWNYWHKHRGFMVNSILGHFDLSQLAPFHWSIPSLVSSHLYCTQVNSVLSIFCTFFVYYNKRNKSNCYGGWTLLTVKNLLWEVRHCARSWQGCMQDFEKDGSF